MKSQLLVLVCFSLGVAACSSSSNDGNTGGSAGTAGTSGSGGNSTGGAAGSGGAAGGGGAAGSTGGAAGGGGVAGVAGGAGAAGAAGTGGTGGTGPQTIANTNYGTACASKNLVGPLLPDEANHRYATILTPPTYPFTVTSIAYDLVAAEKCDPSLGHSVDIFKTTSSTLDATPTIIETIDMPPDSGATGPEVTIPVNLTTPVTLQQGESIVVSVRMAPDANNQKSICLLVCNDTQKTGVDFWSNSATTPYSWADLVGVFGYTNNSTIRVTGGNGVI